MENQGAFTRYSDPVDIKNENQIIKLKLCGESRYLIKEEAPIGAVWRGNNESSAFYAWIANNDARVIDIDELEKMDQKLQGKIERTDTLEQIISPLLKIVENGMYQIFYHEPLPITINFNMDADSTKYLGSYYYRFSQKDYFENNKSWIWVDNTIIPTQDFKSLDNNRVVFYKQSIEEGKRPTIITMAVADFSHINKKEFKEQYDRAKIRVDYILECATECNEPQFIIDGHHKAKAYMELQEKASVITLVKIQLKGENEDFLVEKSRYDSCIEDEIGERID